MPFTRKPAEPGQMLTFRREADGTVTRVHDGLQSYLEAELPKVGRSGEDVRGVIAKFDPTIVVTDAAWAPGVNSTWLALNLCRGTFDTFRVTVQLPNAPAPARIPDDHLLAAIAGTDGDS